MANFLIELEEDITFLTCKKCAIDTYVELLEAGCRFLQSKSSVVKEFSKDSEVYEVTKLVAEASEEDVYFVFAVESVEHLDDRHIVVDKCVMDLIEEIETIDDEDRSVGCDDIAITFKKPKNYIKSEVETANMNFREELLNVVNRYV